MPELVNTLLGHDLFFLEIVANAWGIELKAPDAASARPVIMSGMTNKETFEELFLALPEKARDAILAIYDREGHMPWAKFSRDFGEVRVMGASRRDRERPDLKPVNPAEVLWYRAIIGRAFLNFKNEPQEYAYLPDEIIDLVQPYAVSQKSDLARIASPGEILVTKLTDDSILNDSCTMLAAIRKGIHHQPIHHMQRSGSEEFLLQLLRCANIFMSDEQLNADLIRELLEAARGKSLLTLFSVWLSCAQLNELTMLPRLLFETPPHNNSVAAREFLLEKVFDLETNQWWNIQSFVNSIHQQDPDFLRPAGDYDSWFVKDKDSGGYLRGFINWNHVEGEFIRFMLNGPFYWLGIIDLASSDESAENCAFRVSDVGIALFARHAPNIVCTKEEKVQINPMGKIVVPNCTPLAIRYQIARFCDWIKSDQSPYQYQISAQSLQSSQEQGLKISHLLSLLQKVLSHPIPAKVNETLDNWDKNGREVEIRRVVLLKVTNSQILNALQKSKHKKFIEEILTDNMAIIHPGSAGKVADALFELGYLSDWTMD